MDLEKIPVEKQRQDSLNNQLADLKMVATRLGMYDAADAISQWCKDMPVVKYGCHCDLEEGMKPDECVIDNNGVIGNYCIYAKEGMRKEQCQYWRICKE